MSINIFSDSFITSKFPGAGGITSPVIDKFVNLSDSLSTSQYKIDQTVYAQYYNQLAKAAEAAAGKMLFVPATQSGSGLAGIPTYSPSCFSGVGSGAVGVSGNSTVDKIFGPYIFKTTLYNLWQNASSRYSYSLREKPSGGIVPFEIIVTSATGYNYDNVLYGGFTLRKGEDLYNLIVGNGNVQVAISLQPKRNTFGVPSSSALSSSSVNTNYNTIKYLNNLGCSCYTVSSSDHLIIRGMVWDRLKTFDNPSIETDDSDIGWSGQSWVLFASNVEVVVTVTRFE